MSEFIWLKKIKQLFNKIDGCLIYVCFFLIYFGWKLELIYVFKIKKILMEKILIEI